MLPEPAVRSGEEAVPLSGREIGRAAGASLLATGVGATVLAQPADAFIPTDASCAFNDPVWHFTHEWDGHVADRNNAAAGIQSLNTA
jgi:hypothetical protein